VRTQALAKNTTAAASSAGAEEGLPDMWEGFYFPQALT
jgi:hypothetical protein